MATQRQSHLVGRSAAAPGQRGGAKISDRSARTQNGPEEERQRA